jgi:hypothetical protein
VSEPIEHSFKRIASDINRSPDRYTQCCGAFLYLVQLVKMHSEDMHDVLSDVIEILDGRKPSDRCKLRPVSKK